jgi:hypothetical protein
MRPVTTLLIGLLMLAAMPVAGQSKADPEVINYTLSMEKLRKLVPPQRGNDATRVAADLRGYGECVHRQRGQKGDTDL